MTVGIIAEYNPFHLGHAHHLAMVRKKAGDQPVVVVMSPAFVQRGEPALLDPFLRARMALKQGASLVLQLPTYYAAATAEWFARGGITLLKRSCIVDAVSFGIEDPSCLPLFQEASSYLSPETKAYQTALKEYLKTEPSFAIAREKALEHLLDAPLPKEPNAILALEYLKAIRSFPEWDPELIPIKREGMGYLDTNLLSEEDPCSGEAASSSKVLPSAMALRQLAMQQKDICRYLPDPCSQMLRQAMTSPDFSYVFPKDLYPALSYRLSQHTAASLREIDEVAEGLENRILAAFQKTGDYASLIEALKTKRYPTARLKRILLNIVLHITASRKDELGFQNGPPYIRVIGVREDALSLLSDLKKNADLPVIINLAKDIDLLSGNARTMLDDELRFGRYYATLSASFPRNELSQGLIIEKD